MMCLQTGGVVEGVLLQALKPKALSHQQPESEEKGKPQNLAPSHGLDGQTKFLTTYNRISLDIPFYRTR